MPHNHNGTNPYRLGDLSSEPIDVCHLLSFASLSRTYLVNYIHTYTHNHSIWFRVAVSTMSYKTSGFVVQNHVRFVTV